MTSIYRRKPGCGAPGGVPAATGELAPVWASSRVLRWVIGLPACVAGITVISVVAKVLGSIVPASSVLVLYLLVIVPAAITGGIGVAVAASVVAALAYDYLFTPPLYTLDLTDPENAVGLGIFLITAIVVGEYAARLRRATQESARLYREQSALLRVATQAAGSVSPSPVFEAVTREAGLLCGADLAVMGRYEEDGSATAVAVWSKIPGELQVGTRSNLIDAGVAREVWQSGRPARISGFAPGMGSTLARDALELGIRSSVACPIVVAGRVWGILVAATKSERSFRPGLEAQIARFTDVVAMAILTNAQGRAELAASRARVVAAADEARRRLGRDLHDGAQQRLVSSIINLRMAQDAVPAELTVARADLGRVAEQLTEALEELRNLTQGVHPAILSDAGLEPALRMLARRSTVPVSLHVDTESRYPPPVELAAFYVVSEALTNAIKHAHASQVEVVAEGRDGRLAVRIHDDGVGGADPRGSGLIGLRDRVDALGGSIMVDSPVGGGTTIQIALPTEQKDSKLLDWSR